MASDKTIVDSRTFSMGEWTDHDPCFRHNPFAFEDGSFSGTVVMGGKKVELSQDFKGFNHLDGTTSLRLDASALPAFWVEIQFKKHPTGAFIAESGSSRYRVTAKGRMSDDPGLLTATFLAFWCLKINAVDGEIEVILPRRFFSEL